MYFCNTTNKKVIIVIFWHKIKHDSVLELHFKQDTNWLFGEERYRFQQQQHFF